MEESEGTLRAKNDIEPALLWLCGPLHYDFEPREIIAMLPTRSRHHLLFYALD